MVVNFEEKVKTNIEGKKYNLKSLVKICHSLENLIICLIKNTPIMLFVMILT